MDAVELLKNDHDKLRELFDELEKLPENETARHEEIFGSVKALLKAHEAIEEEIFYQRLMKSSETRETVLEGFQEHHVADIVMKEVDEISARNEMWAVKAKVLKELVEHHIEEEEKELFPGARKVLDQSELAALGREMEDRKHELLDEAA